MLSILMPFAKNHLSGIVSCAAALKMIKASEEAVEKVILILHSSWKLHMNKLENIKCQQKRYC